MIKWNLQKICDSVRSGAAEPGEFSVRALKEGIGGNRGLIDLNNLKQQLHHYLLVSDIDNRFKGVNSGQRKDKAVKSLKSHSSYRQF